MGAQADPGTVVFVYGTLTDPDVAGRVISRFSYLGPATLGGCHRVDGDYPTLAPGGTVDGRLLRTPDLDALDAYEGVDRGLYVRVDVPLAAGDGDGGAAAAGERADTVAVYVGDPERLSAPAAWPGEGSFEARVARFVSSNQVTVRTDDDRLSPV